jgi:S-(hydroxymethyl)glutathione dehydrogenase/alcohol dehydrogenase
MPDGTFRFHADGEDFGAMCMLGTFAERSVISEYSCVKVDDHLPLDKAVLVGCGVPTGWGSAVYAGGVTPGDTVVVYGIGGIGINSVQGASHGGATYVVAVDPLAMKRQKAEELGATHSCASAQEAQEAVGQLTRGVGADVAIITVDVVDDSVVSAAFDVIRKGGTVVITGLADPAKHTVHLSGAVMTLYQKTIKGTLFGDANPIYDIPRLLGMYDAGQLKLDELVTRTYSLDQLNEGYEDLVAGRNIRGVVLHATESAPSKASAVGATAG